MAKTDPLDPGVPAGTEDPKLGNDRIQELARAVAELLVNDHYMGADGGAGVGYNEDDAGEHAKVTLRVGSKPTFAANKGFLYAKDVSSKVEIFLMDEDGDEIQLSSGGVFNMALLTGKTIDTPTLTSPVIKTGVSGTAVLDEDDMASDSATKLATQQSIKAFTDALTTMVPAVSGAGAGYAGEESVTLPNGLVMKMGRIATGALTGTLTFGDAFGTAVKSIVVGMEDAGINANDYAGVTAYDLNGFDWKVLNAATDIHWTAIGY